MNIYKVIAIYLFAAACFPAAAYLTSDFPGWNTLQMESSDIFVARCNETPDPYDVWKDGHQVDFQGLINSSMQIAFKIRGTASLGGVQITSTFWPKQGEYYLIFARHKDDCYQAVEDFRVILLGTRFSTNGIAGKTPDVQIQILLKKGLDIVNERIQQDEAERKQLEEAFQK